MRGSRSTALAQVLETNHAALCQTVDPLSGMPTGQMHASLMLELIQSRLHKRADGGKYFYHMQDVDDCHHDSDDSAGQLP